MKTFARRGIVLAAALISAHVLLIAIEGLSDDRGTADLAIVFGNTVAPDGRPSPRLEARLEATRALWRAGRVKWIVVSGGRGAEGFEEADVMAAWLVEHGVPPARVLPDREGWTTGHTAVNAKRMMNDRALRSAYVVTQWFHVPRAKLATRRA